jgi:hypothetical protein
MANIGGVQISNSTFSDIGGAVSDIFAGVGAKYKAQGDLLEAQQYDLAAAFAEQNVGFTKISTGLKAYQEDRSIAQTLGEQRADVASAGFGSSGSALDIMADSVSQGAILHETTQFQGLITEASYQEQADSYKLMAGAARMAASAEENAGTGDFISGAIKGVAAIATMIP